jgi:hypothetical protein
VTDEEPAVVEAWLAKAKPTYPIAITKGAFESQIKVPHFPYSAVIDPDGKIVYAGDSGGGEGKLGDALAKSKKQGLWPRSLSKVTRLMLGDQVKAYAELRKLLDGGKVVEADKPYVESFVAYLEGQAKSALTEAQALKGEGQVLKAQRKIESIARAVPPFPSTADSAALLKELQALPDYKREVAGGESYLEAEKLEKDGEYLDAFEAYKGIAKKFAGAQIAESARTQAERLRTEGKPGYEAACDVCRKARRACDKHRKEVKL